MHNLSLTDIEGLATEGAREGVTKVQMTVSETIFKSLPEGGKEEIGAVTYESNGGTVQFIKDENTDKH